MKTYRTYDLENRLIEFTSGIICLADKLEMTYALDVLKKQLIRSACGATLNYGEVQGAESRRDFIPKNSIVLKELKECKVNLKLMLKIIEPRKNNISALLNEAEQLIAIFFTIIKNAKSGVK